MSAHLPNRRRSAFTLLELILSMTVLTAIVAVLVQVMSNVQRVWRGGADDAATARIAFLALDRIAADLAAAAQGPLPFDPIATKKENDGEEETAASQNSLRPPILVIAPAKGTTAPLPPQKVADVLGEGESETAFSRVAVLCDASRPVWTDDESSLRPLRRPPRATGETSEASPLRGLLRIRYDVVPREDSAADEAVEAASSPRLCHDLVRTVAGLRVDDTEDQSDDWWNGDEAPNGFGASEVLARNVVWFGVTVPDFLGVTTNSTGAANSEFQVWGKYSTVEEAAQPLLPQPLPPLVDVVLALVSDRTLSRAEAQPQGDARREAILREGLRVYTRRVQLR